MDYASGLNTSMKIGQLFLGMDDEGGCTQEYKSRNYSCKVPRAAPLVQKDAHEAVSRWKQESEGSSTNRSPFSLHLLRPLTLYVK